MQLAPNDVLARKLRNFTDPFLARVAASQARFAPAARWEQARRVHESRREELLAVGFRNPTPARDLRAGDVISQGGPMRALVRQAFTLPISRQVVLGVSRIDLVTGVPEEQVHELPPLPGDDARLHLVTRSLAEVAPYALPLAVA